MRILSRFHFDHDPTDVIRRLRALEARGLEHGADVTIYYCDACDYGRAEFTDPQEEGT